MMCVEGEIAAAGSAALANGQIGTQGLFAAIQARGNVQVGFSAATGIITVQPYTAANLAGAGLVGAVKVFVYGSEYAKGSTTPNYNAATAPAGYISVTPSFTQFSNNPLIIRSKYTVNGSDTAQIGWVEVATEDGTGGYLWYLKA